LKAELQNGYDEDRPIYLYEDAIIDGWNRYRACKELAIEPTYKHFVGSSYDAIRFILSTNTRRNLSSSQWAAIAVESEDIVKAIREQVEKERREKISANNGMKQSEAIEEKILQSSKPETNKTDKLIAETFNTNSKYIQQAEKLREQAPDKFQQVNLFFVVVSMYAYGNKNATASICVRCFWC
jgi:hypothetical protein